jgi:hypothetical protein
MRVVRLMKTKKAMRRGGVLLATLLGLAPANALARNICVPDDDGGSYLFSKVEKLRPGGVVPLTGVRVAPFPLGRPVAPVTGAAVMETDGTVHIGVLVHTMSASLNPTSSSFLVSVDGNAEFTGTGTFDGAGNFRPTSSTTWTNVDCRLIAVP